MSTYFFIAVLYLAFILVVYVQSNKYDMNFPKINTSSENPRLLSFILAYDLNHLESLLLIFNEYLSLCESGWDVTIFIMSCSVWPLFFNETISLRTYCYRTSSSIPIHVNVQNKSVGIYLSNIHRKIMAEELFNYDLFVYQEDDVVLRHSHIIAYLHESEKLHRIHVEAAVPNHYNIGFQRYRFYRSQGNIDPAYSGHPITDDVITDIEWYDDSPKFVPICIHNHPYLRLDRNQHQAVYVLTRDQVIFLQHKCSFLNHTGPREFMSSFSIFGYKYGGCQLMKVIPATKLMAFSVNHYFTDNVIEWHYAVIPTVHNLLHGIGADKSFPECWPKLPNSTDTTTAQ